MSNFSSKPAILLKRNFTVRSAINHKYGNGKRNAIQIVTELLDSCHNIQLRSPQLFLGWTSLCLQMEIKGTKTHLVGLLGQLMLVPGSLKSLNPKTNPSCFLTPSPVQVPLFPHFCKRKRPIQPRKVARQ